MTELSTTSSSDSSASSSAAAIAQAAASTTQVDTKQQQQQQQLQQRRTWSQLKSIVELSRKLMFVLNRDVPANITFRELSTDSSQQCIYFLASTKKREITIKHVTLKLKQQVAGAEAAVESIKPTRVFFDTVAATAPADSQQQLTKEEQLLRERKRCSFTGITSYTLSPACGRIVFNERSGLYYFDHNNINQPQTTTDVPNEIATASKGAIDVQMCPLNASLVSYVLNDNLWLYNIDTKQEFKLTNTSDPVKSGVPSFVVQEEFSRYTGYWWQPIAERLAASATETLTTYRIAYEEVDDAQVDLTYITPSCVTEFGYDSYRYPKAGTKNSRVQLKLIEITFSSVANKPPLIKRKEMHKSFYELFDWYEYLVRAGWTPNGQYVWVQLYDRLQMHSAMTLVPVDFFTAESDASLDVEMKPAACASTSHVYLIHEHFSESWINTHNIMHIFSTLQDNNKLRYITALDETGFLHLYMMQVSLDAADFHPLGPAILKSTACVKTLLTNGDWCVEADENVAVDEENGLVYFSAYKDPLESHLFALDLNQPLKCKQLTAQGFSHSVFINAKCNMFVSVCSNLSTPYATYVFQLNNQKLGLERLEAVQIAKILSREDLKQQQQPSSGSPPTTSDSSLLPNLMMISLLKLNLDSFLRGQQQQQQQLDEAAIIGHLFKPPQVFTFLTDDNCKLYGMIYMPYNYEHGVKYPTVQYVYGGPKVQIVTNSYKANKYSRFNVLALLGYCVVVIDSRGSDCRGVAFETHIKHRMGTVEISDQVKGLEVAATIFNCIDMKRVAIYGWSYGGYMSLMGLAQRPDVYKVAISGAPVTSWSLYDTAYTERYMGLPDVNKDEYLRGSVLNCAKQFPDEENRLLIIHGMIDENVHFAHTRQLIDALIKENKPYQLQIYPNERHGIRSPEASVHCDINFYSFLEQHL